MISFKLFLFAFLLSLSNISADEGNVECILADNVDGICTLSEDCLALQINNTLLDLDLSDNFCSSNGSMVCCPQNITDFSIYLSKDLMMDNDTSNDELEWLLPFYLYALQPHSQNITYTKNANNPNGLFSLPLISRFSAENDTDNSSQNGFNDFLKGLIYNPLTITNETWENDEHTNLVASGMCFNYSKMCGARNLDDDFLYVTVTEGNVTIRKRIDGLDPVFGGSAASPQDFKAAAIIGCKSRTSNKLEWQCGGSLISEYFVLTAAHCLITDCGPVTVVRLGDINLMNKDVKETAKMYRVSERIRYPLYNDSELYHDIGLLRLEKPVYFTDYVQPACLPTSWKHVELPDNLTAFGWGSTEYGSSMGSDVLLKVNLSIVTEKECNRHYIDETELLNNGINDEWQICAGNPGKDTCQGDSGGPLSAVHPDHRCLKDVYGITSFGKPCGEDVPGIYTRIEYYINWIERIVWPDHVADVRQCFDDAENNRPRKRKYCDMFYV